MSNKDITEIAYRKQYYRDNLEKKREDARKYYHRNKEFLNAEKREKAAIKRATAVVEKLKEEGIIAEVPSKPKRIPNRTKSVETLRAEKDDNAYNMAELAKIIGITYSKLRSKVAVNPRYMMPKHMYIMMDGSKVYNKAEIDEWLPYIIDLLAFDPCSTKKNRITISGNAMLTINFLRKNKKVVKYCDDIRLKQITDNRINNRGSHG